MRKKENGTSWRAPTRHFVVLRRVWFLIIKYLCFEAYPLLAPKCRVGAGRQRRGEPAGGDQAIGGGDDRQRDRSQHQRRGGRVMGAEGIEQRAQIDVLLAPLAADRMVTVGHAHTDIEAGIGGRKYPAIAGSHRPAPDHVHGLDAAHHGRRDGRFRRVEIVGDAAAGIASMALVPIGADCRHGKGYRRRHRL